MASSSSAPFPRVFLRTDVLEHGLLRIEKNWCELSVITCLVELRAFIGEKKWVSKAQWLQFIRENRIPKVPMSEAVGDRTVDLRFRFVEGTIFSTCPHTSKG